MMRPIRGFKYPQSGKRPRPSGNWPIPYWPTPPRGPLSYWPDEAPGSNWPEGD